MGNVGLNSIIPTVKDVTDIHGLRSSIVKIVDTTDLDTLYTAGSYGVNTYNDEIYSMYGN